MNVSATPIESATPNLRGATFRGSFAGIPQRRKGIAKRPWYRRKEYFTDGWNDGHVWRAGVSMHHLNHPALISLPSSLITLLGYRGCRDLLSRVSARPVWHVAHELPDGTDRRLHWLFLLGHAICTRLLPRTHIRCTHELHGHLHHRNLRALSSISRSHIHNLSAHWCYCGWRPHARLLGREQHVVVCGFPRPESYYPRAKAIS